MNLHVINKTEPGLWRNCVTAIKDGDTLLLIEDAVYAVLSPATLPTLLPAGIALCVLADDLALRGVTVNIAASVRCISYREFVSLCLSHKQVINW